MCQHNNANHCFEMRRRSRTSAENTTVLHSASCASRWKRSRRAISSLSRNWSSIFQKTDHKLLCNQLTSPAAHSSPQGARPWPARRRNPPAECACTTQSGGIDCTLTVIDGFVHLNSSRSDRACSCVRRMCHTHRAEGHFSARQSSRTASTKTTAPAFFICFITAPKTSTR